MPLVRGQPSTLSPPPHSPPWPLLPTMGEAGLSRAPLISSRKTFPVEWNGLEQKHSGTLNSSCFPQLLYGFEIFHNINNSKGEATLQPAWHSSNTYRLAYSHTWPTRREKSGRNSLSCNVDLYCPVPGMPLHGDDRWMGAMPSLLCWPLACKFSPRREFCSKTGLVLQWDWFSSASNTSYLQVTYLYPSFPTCKMGITIIVPVS